MISFTRSDSVGGGGVVAGIFRDLFTGSDSVGGVVAGIVNVARSIAFLGSGTPTGHPPFIGTHGKKKTFTKSLGGAMAPLAPPWLRHCCTKWTGAYTLANIESIFASLDVRSLAVGSRSGQSEK